VYQPSSADRTALAAAGYTGYPTSGATYANTPFPYWRCIAQGLQGDEPGEKCTGAINRTTTKQDNYGLSGQLSFENAFLGHKNKFIAGAGYDGSAVKFTQSKQWGYVNADHSITGVSYKTVGGVLVPAMADGVNGGDVDGVPADDRVDLRAKTNTWSLFATDTLSIKDLWHLTGSLRYNHTQIKNRDQIVATGADSLSGDHTYSRINPALGVTFTPNKQVTAYVGYSEGSRAPTAIELGCANPDNPCRLPNSMAGDPHLKQVVAKTWESGVRVRASSNFSWNAGVFRTDNRDDIMFMAAPSSTTYGYFDNVSKTRRQGGDLGFNAKVDKLTVSAGYTYLDATYQNDMEVNGSANSTNSSGRGLEGEIDVKKGDRIPNIPNHIFKIRADYQLTPLWVAGLGVVGVSSSYVRGNENNLHQAGGTTLNNTTPAYLGSGKTPGYAIFNFNTRYDATEQLRLFAQVSNLFDKRYSTAGQLGAAGFDANGNIANIRGYGGNTTTGYSLQQTTFYAPGSPRAIWLGMRYTFDKPVSGK
jgi:outer membrane receptor protein involved in Fe transport